MVVGVQDEELAAMLRLWMATHLRRDVHEGASVEDILDQLKTYVRWLETAWFDCHSREVQAEKGLHSLLETWSDQDHVEGPTDDAEKFVHAALGYRVSFETVPDYDKAVDLAVRAYCEGVLRAP